MGNRVAFYGTIGTGEGRAVAEVMRLWRSGRWAVKQRDLGLELVHDDEEAGLYVYCHLAQSDEPSAPFHLLEGETVGPPEAARALLLELLRLLADRGISSSIDYTLEDPDGRALSDEVTLDERSLSGGKGLTDEALVEAYRTTRYELLPEGREPVGVRIGERHPELGGAWAFLTAYNPGHERPGDAQNQAAQARLRRAIESLGLLPEPARGVGVDAFTEPMFFVRGLSRDEAERLGKAFHQWAVVVAGPGAEAQLVLLPRPR
jgi:hypothetical protein